MHIHTHCFSNTVYIRVHINCLIKACYSKFMISLHIFLSHYFREGDLRVIRPFVYTREKDLRDFAESRKLPVIPENCPACFEAPKVKYCCWKNYLTLT